MNYKIYVMGYKTGKTIKKICIGSFFLLKFTNFEEVNSIFDVYVKFIFVAELHFIKINEFI